MILVERILWNRLPRGGLPSLALPVSKKIMSNCSKIKAGAQGRISEFAITSSEKVEELVSMSSSLPIREKI